MKPLTRAYRALRGAFSRARRETDLEAEVRHHLEMQT